MLNAILSAVAADLLGTRRAPRVNLDLRPGLARLRPTLSRCRSALTAGRDALRVAAGVAVACVALAVFAAPVLWEAVR